MFSPWLQRPSKIKAQTRALLLFCCTLLLPALFLSSYSHSLLAGPVEEDWEAAAPDSDDPKVNRLDGSHGYLTNQTQTLANWMDSFFGDTDYDSEQA
ncbi:MAG: hypothetical protein P8N51_08540 [Pseudomonadales bacterium]|nr:hypothetical protein [Pseudomonadales bacterium]MDG1443017.1 hypothetical protein [Pseudomonadales bacterium]